MYTNRMNKIIAVVTAYFGMSACLSAQADNYWSFSSLATLSHGDPVNTILQENSYAASFGWYPNFHNFTLETGVSFSDTTSYEVPGSITRTPRWSLNLNLLYLPKLSDSLQLELGLLTVSGIRVCSEQFDYVNGSGYASVSPQTCETFGSFFNGLYWSIGLRAKLSEQVKLISALQGSSPTMDPLKFKVGIAVSL
jgi:hypothetical protein